MANYVEFVSDVVYFPNATIQFSDAVVFSPFYLSDSVSSFFNFRLRDKLYYIRDYPNALNVYGSVFDNVSFGDFVSGSFSLLDEGISIFSLFDLFGFYFPVYTNEFIDFGSFAVSDYGKFIGSFTFSSRANFIEHLELSDDFLNSFLSFIFLEFYSGSEGSASFKDFHLGFTDNVSTKSDVIITDIISFHSYPGESVLVNSFLSDTSFVDRVSTYNYACCSLYWFNCISGFGFENSNIAFDVPTVPQFFYPYLLFNTFDPCLLLGLDYLHVKFALYDSFSVEEYSTFEDTYGLGFLVYDQDSFLEVSSILEFFSDVNVVDPSSFTLENSFLFFDRNQAKLTVKSVLFDVLSFYSSIVDSGLIVRVILSNVFSSQADGNVLNAKVDFVKLFDRLFSRKELSFIFNDYVFLFDRVSNVIYPNIDISLLSFSTLYSATNAISTSFNNLSFIEEFWVNNEVIKNDFLLRLSFDLFSKVISTFSDSIRRFKSYFSYVYEGEDLIELFDVLNLSDSFITFFIEEFLSVFRSTSNINVYWHPKVQSINHLFYFDLFTYQYSGVERADVELLSVVSFFDEVIRKPGFVFSDLISLTDNVSYDRRYFSFLKEIINFVETNQVSLSCKTRDKILYYDNRFCLQFGRLDNTFSLSSSLNSLLGSYFSDVLTFDSDFTGSLTGSLSSSLFLEDGISISLQSKLISYYRLRSLLEGFIWSGITFQDFIKLLGFIFEAGSGFERFGSNVVFVFQPIATGKGDVGDSKLTVYVFDRKVTGFDEIVTVEDGIYEFSDDEIGGAIVLNLRSIGEQREKRIDKVFIGGEGSDIDIWVDGRVFNYKFNRDRYALVGKGLIGEDVKVVVYGVRELDWVKVRLDMLRRAKYE